LYPPPPGREELDYLVVGDGDDKDGERGGSSHVESEMGMLSEGEKRLLRTVARRGQAVSAEPYPGKKSDQGDVLTGLAAERIQRGTEQGCADRLHVRRPLDLCDGRLEASIPDRRRGFRRFPDS
jgi:hypothetical protein